MTTSTQTRRHLDVADRTYGPGQSNIGSSVHQTTISFPSTRPAPVNEPVRPDVFGWIRAAATATFRALVSTARSLSASWQAGAAKDALIEEHRDQVRSQIHLFGGRY